MMTDPQMTIQQALNLALHQAMQEDASVVCIGEDIAGGAGIDGSDGIGGVFGVTSGLVAKFGRGRVIDTPISETAFLGMAVGSAMSGLKPVVEIMFCDFAGVCFDQILNQAAKIRFLSNGRIAMPLVIRMTMGAGDGSGAMHSASLHNLFASIAGLNVVYPSSPAHAAGLLKTGLKDESPLILLEHKGLYGRIGEVDAALSALPLGKGFVLRGGEECTIVTVGGMVPVVLEAADRLAKNDINAEVIDLCSIVPFDLKLIADSLLKTGRLIVVDEGASFAGLGDAIVSSVVRECFEALKAPPVLVCPPNTPVPYGREAEKIWLPSSDQIVNACLKIMER
jgi:pyruvate dehydrogenase E1 component beta subunit